MPQSLSRVFVHLIFSTKGRHPFLKDKYLREELHSFMAGFAKRLEFQPVCSDDVADHVHLLQVQPRTEAVATCVKEVKRISTKWAKEKGMVKFAWQAGYGVFSVSQSNVADVYSESRSAS